MFVVDLSALATYRIFTVLSPPRVLVVDDERYIRGLLSELLAVWGCQADVAASGTEGLKLFKQKSYDLVLTDYAMPDGSGLELVENVRNSDAAVGVIMLTASGADLDSHGQRLGFTLLRKPLRIDHLEAAVKQALGDRKIEA
jgi:DNA-binding response OmpR family regulator